MTKPRRARTDYRAVKHALLAGSVLASLAGTRLLAWQDQDALTSPPSGAQPTAPQPARITLEPLTLPPEMGGMDEVPFVIDLQAIPTAVSARPRPVQPVARSRSSR